MTRPDSPLVAALGLLLLGLPLGCDDDPRSHAAAAPTGGAGERATGAPAKQPARAPAEPAYAVPERSPEALRRELAQGCEQARQHGALVLLEFSAAWCKDCRRLSAMKREPALAGELEHFRQVVVNVGEFDRHPELLGHFGVRAIARWELLEPSDCQRPAWTWKRRGGRTLEPETGQQRVTPAQLASWLRERRAS